MIPYVVPIVLLAATWIIHRIEPRTLWCGILLLAAIFDAAITVLVTVMRGVSVDAATYVMLGVLVTSIIVLVATSIILILNGLEILRRETRSVGNMLSLVLGLAMLCTVAVLIFSWQYSFNTGFGFAILAMLPFAYLGFGLLAYVLYSAIYQREWSWRGTRPGVIVVLGAGLVRNTVPPLLASRLDKARELFDVMSKEGPAPLLVVSGGKGSDEARSEASAMAEYLADSGVDRAAIVCEDRSRNTRENISLTKKVLDKRGITVDADHPMVCVTNNFHAFRAALLMRSLHVAGCTVGLRTAGYFWPSATIREYLAILRDNIVIAVAGAVVCAIPLVIEVARSLFG